MPSAVLYQSGGVRGVVGDRRGAPEGGAIIAPVRGQRGRQALGLEDRDGIIRRRRRREQLAQQQEGGHRGRRPQLARTLRTSVPA